jgi:hypothetical protein
LIVRFLSNFLFLLLFFSSVDLSLSVPFFLTLQKSWGEVEEELEQLHIKPNTIRILNEVISIRGKILFQSSVQLQIYIFRFCCFISVTVFLYFIILSFFSC